MKKAILVAIIGAFAVSVNAGDWGGKAVVEDKGVIVGCPDTSGSVTVGYMTDYILHGIRLNRDTVMLDVNYTFESVVPITLGVSHYAGINGIRPPGGAATALDETDIYLSAVVADVAGFQVVADYTHRFFPNSVIGSTGELGLTLRKDLGFAEFYVGSDYVLGALFQGGDGWVHRTGVSKEIGITDSVALVLSGSIGYHDGAFFNNSGWSDYNLGVALPIELNCAATLTPFIAYNGVQQWNQFARQGDALYGGISLNVKF